MKKLFIFMSLLITSMSGKAIDFTVGGINYTSTSETTVSVVQSNNESYRGELNIPSQVSYGAKTYSVTAIGERAFRDCSGLTSITIPNSVTVIGHRAFIGCSRLTSITIPNSVTTIGDYAFSGCNSLFAITIPNSVTTIGDGAFEACDSLTAITIPNGVTTIGGGAFSGSGLTSITIPNSVTVIGHRAFIGCRSLTSITIPNSVTTIGDKAFTYCDSLTAINVDANNQRYTSFKGVLLDKIENKLLCAPGGLAGEFVIPNSVTAIGNGAFSSCSSLTSITLPNSVTTIGAWAFEDCHSLTSITLPNSVTTIGGGAFEACSLTNITIPNSVTAIGDDAFSGCSSLTSINVDANNQRYTSYKGVLLDKIENKLLCAPGGLAGEFVIPNSVTIIGEDAFQGCSSLTSITIPNSVTTIGESAFDFCVSLTSITLPNSVTTIGEDAFYECSNLTSIYVTASEPTALSLNELSGLYTTATLYVPTGTLSAYRAATNWGQFKNIVEYDVTGIDEVKQNTSKGDYLLSTTAGGLLVKAAKAGVLGIYNASGALVKNVPMQAGENVIALPKGIYIIAKTKVAIP